MRSSFGPSGVPQSVWNIHFEILGPQSVWNIHFEIFTQPTKLFQPIKQCESLLIHTNEVLILGWWLWWVAGELFKDFLWLFFKKRGKGHLPPTFAPPMRSSFCVWNAKMTSLLVCETLILKFSHGLKCVKHWIWNFHTNLKVWKQHFLAERMFLENSGGYEQPGRRRSVWTKDSDPCRKWMARNAPSGKKGQWEFLRRFLGLYSRRRKRRLTTYVLSYLVCRNDQVFSYWVIQAGND